MDSDGWILKGYLLDTNVALLAMSTPELLSAPVKAAIEKGPAFLSVVVYWEVTIKSTKGMIDVGDPRQWFTHSLDALGLRPLLLRPEHIAAISSLPPIHQDPFDRALIAQSIAEDMTLVTTDGAIPNYASDTVRVVR